MIVFHKVPRDSLLPGASMDETALRLGPSVLAGSFFVEEIFRTLPVRYKWQTVIVAMCVDVGCM